MEKIPVTIVTGALGAGKTTFVNYVLTAEHGLRVGVIVNEYGEVGIDGALMMTTKEKMIELPNGCICCTVRGDLLEAAQQLINTGKIDYLMVETSGLAEAIPVAQTFNVQPLVDQTELDSIICIIDAVYFDDNLKRNATALEQLQCSDIVLLNKVDLVDKNKAEQVKKEIKKYVPKAQIIETIKGQANLKLLLGVGKFDPNKQLEWNKKEHDHAHHAGVQTASFIIGPVDSDKFQEFWINLPENIFRAKGIICIKESKPGAGDELRVSFNKVGKHWDMDFTRPWEEGEKKETRVVFIGTKIKPKEMKKQLDACA
ncbi:MAG: GTP-binding protein [Candidatus Woesearchaeota archaeon]